MPYLHTLWTSARLRVGRSLCLLKWQGVAVQGRERLGTTIWSFPFFSIWRYGSRCDTLFKTICLGTATPLLVWNKLYPVLPCANGGLRAHTHTQHTLHAYTILHLHLHSDLRLRLHTHNNSGRVISLPVTQGRKLAGREAEVVKVQANRSTNRTCRSQRLNERGIFIPCHFIVPSGCSCACVCVRSCGAPISRLAAEWHGRMKLLIHWRALWKAILQKSAKIKNAGHWSQPLTLTECGHTLKAWIRPQTPKANLVKEVPKALVSHSVKTIAKLYLRP